MNDILLNADGLTFEKKNRMKYTIIFLLTICNLYSFSQEKPTGLPLQDQAPDFKAIDQNGKPVELKSLLSKGPVVLVFYRGQWCPYCNRYLSALEDSLSIITSKGATVVAVTPEIQENISKTVEKSKASFPILHDEDLTIMKNYKVAFAVD
ncbi:MAG: peroxiredoxin family protein, partial [Flammeovirgaceae bacterium]|nr:peroxiredoxin family protein [Flammeovirgaceae bacterium]